jgi:hypothetical protein
MEATNHSGGRLRLSHHDSAGRDIQAGVDASLGEQVATFAKSDLFDWLLGNLSLLVAQGGQERYADRHDLRRGACCIIALADCAVIQLSRRDLKVPIQK